MQVIIRRKGLSTMYAKGAWCIEIAKITKTSNEVTENINRVARNFLQLD